MKKRMLMTLDDFDGTPADETIRFSVDGATYELDLRKKHAAEFRRMLKPWIDAGQRVSTKTRRPPKKDGDHAVRAWALEVGVPVNAQGRIPTAVREQYEASKVSS